MEIFAHAAFELDEDTSVVKPFRIPVRENMVYDVHGVVVLAPDLPSAAGIGLDVAIGHRSIPGLTSGLPNAPAASNQPDPAVYRTIWWRGVFNPFREMVRDFFPVPIIRIGGAQYVHYFLATPGSNQGTRPVQTMIYAEPVAVEKREWWEIVRRTVLGV